jgi:DNA-binding PadR family transcriptional regulator
LQAQKGQSALHSTTKKVFSQFLQRPQGAPRGFLHFFILHRISLGPTHGYEIAQFIDEKTEGAWRPGAGSIYPTLKKLVSEGLIKASPKSKSSESSQRIYEITPDGMECVKQGRDMLANAGRRWSAMRGIYVELMDPSQLPTFLVEGSRAHFQMSQEIIESKISKLSRSDAEFTLKEYALNLERQLKWTNAKLEELQKNAETNVPKVTIR